MKKVLVLLSSVFMAGCFICHKTDAQTEIIVEEEVIEQQLPVPAEKIITRYTISEAANFTFDSKEVRPDMNKMGEVMKDTKNYPDAVVFIIGHTDNIGSEEYNKDLSLDRARAVAQELVKRGCDSNRIRIHGAGSTIPLASNDTAEGRAQNRRVDVVFVKQ